MSNNSKFRRYYQLLLVVFAAGSIYPLIYLKSSYQETILEVYGMSLQELNMIYSILGLVFLIGYLPSGYLSDKFSSKKLLFVSLFMTGLGGFWFAQVPSYSNIIIIFCIWGVFAVFTFWGAHMKLVKMLSTPEEEGRFFGILDGGRGLVEAILASIAFFIFSRILGDSTDIALKTEAITSVVYMYSIVLMIAAGLVFFFVDDDKKEKKDIKKEKTPIKMGDVGAVFKNKRVIILGVIIFCAYVVTWTYYYYSGFLQTNVGLDAVTVGKIMTISLWMRPIGGICGGFLADKVGKTNVLLTALIGCSVCLVIMSTIPTTMSIGVFFALTIFASLLLYVCRGTYWSLLGDCKVNAVLIGTTIGAVSLIGYLPDVLLPVFNSYLFNIFGDTQGYNAYFLSSAIIGFIGVVFVIYFKKLTKNDDLTDVLTEK